MASEHIKLKIKSMPPVTPGGMPQPVTTRVWLDDGSKVSLGIPTLEPGEVVLLEKEKAKKLLKASPYHLEETSDPHTRELYVTDNWKERSLHYTTKNDETPEARRRRLANKEQLMGEEGNIAQLLVENKELKAMNTKLMQKVESVLARLDG